MLRLPLEYTGGGATSPAAKEWKHVFQFTLLPGVELGAFTFSLSLSAGYRNPDWNVLIPGARVMFAFPVIYEVLVIRVGATSDYAFGGSAGVRSGGVASFSLGHALGFVFQGGRDFGEESTYLTSGIVFDFMTLSDPVGAVLSRSQTRDFGQ